MFEISVIAGFLFFALITNIIFLPDDEFEMDKSYGEPKSNSKLKLVTLCKSPNFYIGYITAKNYWVENGKRVNFTISHTIFPTIPDFTGFCIVIGVLCVGIFWRKFSDL